MWLADQHEQGADRPYYFSPGHPKRTHQLTPRQNQELTAEVSAYCAKELDKIGTLYYSKEGYDDYYYGKGAAYGDIHGSVCLLYEQGTSRGICGRLVMGCARLRGRFVTKIIRFVWYDPCRLSAKR